MNIDTSTLIRFAIRAALWGLTYYFVRRGLNPEVTDLSKYQADAIYGSLASFVAAVLFLLIDRAL
jgi:hypothetical protein